MLKRVSILAIVAMLATATVANAFPPLAEWGFQLITPADVTDNVTGGTYAADSGIYAVGSAGSGTHASALTDWTTPTGNGSTESWSSTNWAVGDYWQFCAETTAYENITFQWDAVSSNTGPRDFQIQYNANGGSYSTLTGTYAIRANTAPAWSSGSPTAVDTYLADLSAETSLDNQALVCFRIVNSSTVSANGGTVAATGTSRVDNVRISGDLIPEPTTLALMGLGAIGLVRRRR